MLAIMLETTSALQMLLVTAVRIRSPECRPRSGRAGRNWRRPGPAPGAPARPHRRTGQLPQIGDIRLVAVMGSQLVIKVVFDARRRQVGSRTARNTRGCAPGPPCSSRSFRRGLLPKRRVQTLNVPRGVVIAIRRTPPSSRSVLPPFSRYSCGADATGYGKGRAANCAKKLCACHCGASAASATRIAKLVHQMIVRIRRAEIHRLREIIRLRVIAGVEPVVVGSFFGRARHGAHREHDGRGTLSHEAVLIGTDEHQMIRHADRRLTRRRPAQSTALRSSPSVLSSAPKPTIRLQRIQRQEHVGVDVSDDVARVAARDGRRNSVSRANPFPPRRRRRTASERRGLRLAGVHGMCDFQQRRHAGCIVHRAVEDAITMIGLPGPEMIEVRGQHHRLVGERRVTARQLCDDVVRGDFGKRRLRRGR